MKFGRIITIILFSIFMLQVPTAHSQHSVGSGHYGLPIFPNASGFGLDTKGGSGGKIIKVNNLNREGEGSLLEAIKAEGPRIIVFEVAGIIDLEEHSLEISNPYLTIAGQTAPFPGITIIKGGIKIQSHDIIIQHIKIRPGEAGRKKKSGWEVDGLATTMGAYNVIVDHCSLTWATDENLSASGPRFSGDNLDEWRKNTSHRVVFSNCLIAECLSNSTHAKGEHSKGSLIHDNATDILIIGNLFANNMRRSPYCKGGTQVTILNNYIYNPGSAAIHYNLVRKEWSGHELVTGKIVAAGNSIEWGTDSKDNIAGGYFRGPVEVYWEDNIITGKAHAQEIKGDYTSLTEVPFWPEGLIIQPASDVKSSVLQNAGAFPWKRDVIDQRIISDILSGQGKIIDSEKEVGGYPNTKPVYRKFNAEEWNMNTLTKIITD